VSITARKDVQLELYEREQRGMRIAATCKLTKKGQVWLVPSQSGHGRYTVSPDPESPHCSCPDHETRGLKCKHLFAVEFAMKREERDDGSTTVTQTVTDEWALLGTCPVPMTGDYQRWATQTCALTSASGTHDLYLVYSSAGASLLNVQWFALGAHG